MENEGETPAEEGFEGINEFFEAVDNTPAFDPNTAVTIRTAGGGSTMVPISGPATIAEVLRRTELAIGANVEYWVDGVAVQPDFVLAPGATLTIVGLVKGG
jgi:hypothetical protein